MTHACVCETCGKHFNSQRTTSEICYGCALTRLIGNGAPEEGDFNTALLVSGEMTDEEARDLQEDLESVEQGRSIREDFRDDEDACPICGGDPNWCDCIDRYGDD